MLINIMLYQILRHVYNIDVELFIIDNYTF